MSASIACDLGTAPAIQPLTLNLCYASSVIFVRNEGESTWQVHDIPDRRNITVATKERVSIIVHTLFGSLVLSGMRDELPALLRCAPFTGSPRRVAGSVSGLGANESARIISGIAAVNTASSFTLDMPTGSSDVWAFSGPMAPFLARRVSILRDVPEAATTIPTIDFAVATLMDSARVAIPGVGAADAQLSVFFAGRLREIGFYSSASSPFLITGIPLNNSTDAVHALYVTEPGVWRRDYRYFFGVARDTTITRGPLPTAPVITSTTIGSCFLPRATIPWNAAYPTGAAASFRTRSGSASLSVFVLQSSRFRRGSSSPWTLEVPALDSGCLLQRGSSENVAVSELYDGQLMPAVADTVGVSGTVWRVAAIQQPIP